MSTPPFPQYAPFDEAGLHLLLPEHQRVSGDHVRPVAGLDYVLDINGGQMLVTFRENLRMSIDPTSAQGNSTDCPWFVYTAPGPNVSTLQEGTYFTVFVGGTYFLAEVKRVLKVPTQATSRIKTWAFAPTGREAPGNTRKIYRVRNTDTLDLGASGTSETPPLPPPSSPPPPEASATAATQDHHDFSPLRRTNAHYRTPLAKKLGLSTDDGPESAFFRGSPLSANPEPRNRALSMFASRDVKDHPHPIQQTARATLKKTVRDGVKNLGHSKRPPISAPSDFRKLDHNGDRIHDSRYNPTLFPVTGLATPDTTPVKMSAARPLSPQKRPVPYYDQETGLPLPSVHSVELYGAHTTAQTSEHTTSVVTSKTSTPSPSPSIRTTTTTSKSTIRQQPISSPSPLSDKSNKSPNASLSSRQPSSSRTQHRLHTVHSKSSLTSGSSKSSGSRRGITVRKLGSGKSLPPLPTSPRNSPVMTAQSPVIPCEQSRDSTPASLKDAPDVFSNATPSTSSAILAAPGSASATLEVLRKAAEPKKVSRSTRMRTPSPVAGPSRLPQGLDFGLAKTVPEGRTIPLHLHSIVAEHGSNLHTDASASQNITQSSSSEPSKVYGEDLFVYLGEQRFQFKENASPILIQAEFIQDAPLQSAFTSTSGSNFYFSGSRPHSSENHTRQVQGDYYGNAYYQPPPSSSPRGVSLPRFKRWLKKRFIQ